MNVLERVRRALGLPVFPPFAESEYSDPRNFTTPRGMLEFSIYWESKAIESYALHAYEARMLGDMRSSQLFSHILKEEEEHLEELIARLKELA